MKGELFLLIPFILAIGVSFAGAQNLLCENDSVSIEFSGHNGTVLRFYDKANGCDITRADDGELWRVMLTTESGTKVLTPSDAGQFISHSNSPSEIQMSWFDFPGMDKDLAIHASVRIQTCWPPTSWELVIHKTPSARVPVAHFPRLSNLTKHEEESLAVPVWTGQLLPNPRSVLCASDDARLAWNYPGMMAMQCVAYCAKGGSGLYAACDDTAAYRKTFAFWGNVSGKVDFEMVHYPENGAANSGEWRMPYAAILGALHGDWFDAAERYRSWALQQTWTKESRMRRGLVPAWIEETGMWIWNRGRSEGVLPPAIALQETLGLPVRVFWHWWHGCPYDAGFPEYLPPREGADQFRKAVLDAHAHDVRCVVYMNQRLWGMETESWRVENAERFAVKGEDGKVHPEVYNLFTKSPMASMCIATPFWRGAYAGLAQRAITELGVDGIYMDQACDSMPCYDSSHGHPIGGGRYWLDGFRLLSGDIRKRAAEKRVALTGEGCCEAWLPYLDAMLTLQVSKERYSAPTDPWEPIPFFHSVYHPVAITYGNYSSLTMPPYDDLWPKASAPKKPLALIDRKFSRQFYLEQARAFIWGQQPTLANFLPNQLTERAEELDYVMRIAKVRRLARQYLEHGEFLRPPQLTVANATSPFSRLSIYAGQGEHLAEFAKTHPLALSTAWRARDGNVAIAIASLADAPLSVSLSWNPKEYGISSNGTIFRIAESGRIPVEPFTFPPSSRALTLPPRAVCLFEFIGGSPPS